MTWKWTRHIPREKYHINDQQKRTVSRDENDRKLGLKTEKSVAAV